MQQPPPRKVQYAKFLKNVHSEQSAKLLAKNQHECDLLEDIRSFTHKKAAIEKSYAEALLKISSAYLNKKIPNIPDIKTDAADDRWNMWNVWRTVLEENEKLARARLAACEVFQTQIADEAKSLKHNKVAIAKKSVDNLCIVQKELQACVQDVDKTKKLYFDEEHSAHDVRDKAKDIEEKLKKKKGSFFQSITSLQKNSAKVTSKRDALEEKSTGARNDYLLALAAANAHQNRYFVVDLQQTMLYMEQGVYDKVAEYLSIMGRTELLTCLAMQNSFGIIRDQAQQLTREYNIQCCCLYYPVLKQHIQYEFEPCDNDQVDRITVDHAAAQTLTKEAKRWAQRIAREISTFKESGRKLQALVQLRDSGQKTDPNDPNGPDLETKIDELKQTMRKAETAKMKAEARIECLRRGGVNVDEFLQEVESLSVQDLPRSASSLSMHTDHSGNAEQPSSDSFYDSDQDGGSDHTTVERPGGQRVDSAQSHHRQQREDEDSGGDERRRLDSAEVDALLEQEKQRIDEITAGWDDPTSADWGHDDSAEIAEVHASADGKRSAASGDLDTSQQQQQQQNIYKCTALYSYTAQNPDELSIVESEQLEVVGEGDGDGWLRARNYRGEEGYVPQNYLDVEREPEPQQDGFGADDGFGGAGGLVTHPTGLTQQISFSSVDYTIDDHEAVDPDAHLREQQEKEQRRIEEQQQQQQSQQQQHNHVSQQQQQSKRTQQDNGPQYCMAMYDYEKTSEEELSFMEGDVIQIVKKEGEDVDDGWWEGELNDVRGVFPCILVEACTADGTLLSDGEEDDEEVATPPSLTQPPAHTPPEAPDFILSEELARSLMNEMRERGYVNGDRPDSFNINLSNNQKEQYGQQFGEDKSQAPGIVIDEAPDQPNSSDEEEEEEDEEPEGVKAAREGKKKSGEAAADDDDALGVAQIVITAATPMEEIERPFPGEESNNNNNNNDEEEEDAEEEREEPEPSPPPKDPSPAEECRRSLLERDDDEESDDEKQGDDPQPADSAPFPTMTTTTTKTVTGTTTTTTTTTTIHQQQQRQESIEETSESSSPPPDQVAAKMLVGGRRSIPDELQPDQLQALQSLKESNA